ncbi:MAG: signal peptide peptidase SppA [Planctomycetota bacterium]
MDSEKPPTENIDMGNDRRMRKSDEEKSHGSTLFKGCVVTTIVIGVLGVLTVALLVGIAVFGVFGESGDKSEANIPLKERTIENPETKAKIAIIPIKDMIVGSPSVHDSVTPVAVACARIEQAVEDPDVKGVLVNIDSPGGGITASDILHRRIQKINSGDNAKPVVVHIGDVAASGGYYVAAAADRVWAHPTSITGSIGVIMPLYKATELMDKVGIENNSVQTGPYKDLGSPFSETTEQEAADERRVLQGIIDQLYERFVDVVAEGRDMEEDEVKDLADGRIYTSEQAKDLSLIDDIGYRSGVIEDLKTLCEIERARLVHYQRVLSFPDMLGSVFADRKMSMTFPVDFELNNSSRPMYLWAPGRRDDVNQLRR